MGGSLEAAKRKQAHLSVGPGASAFLGACSGPEHSYIAPDASDILAEPVKLRERAISKLDNPANRLALRCACVSAYCAAGAEPSHAIASSREKNAGGRRCISRELSFREQARQSHRGHPGCVGFLLFCRLFFLHRSITAEGGAGGFVFLFPGGGRQDDRRTTIFFLRLNKAPKQ